MKRIICTFSIALLSLTLPAQDYIEVSKNILKALKNGRSADAYVQQIAEAKPEELASQINTDRKRLAFWINLYNGLIQYKLMKDPALYEDRGDFFSDDILTVAGEEVSFDNLEHGVLRRGTSKYSYGYFKNPFAGDWHKPFMVDEIDWRIHFALNCGASSCPPVRIYDDETVYQQLDASANQYLKSQVRFKKESETVHAPKLMDWFSGDFGGSDGALKILKERGFIPTTDVDLEFNDYDWSLKIGPSVFYDDN